MTKRKFRMMKVDESLAKDFDEIRRARFATIDRKHKKPISMERLSRGVKTDPNWAFIKRNLMRTPREEDRR